MADTWKWPPSGAVRSHCPLSSRNPGSANLVKMLAPLAEDGSLFIVTSSRAGYSKSSRLEGRDVASVVGDVRVALDSLGRGDYVVVGCPAATTRARLRGARRAALSRGVVARQCRATNLNFDWTEGMGPENVEEFALAKKAVRI